MPMTPRNLIHPALALVLTLAAAPALAQKGEESAILVNIRYDSGQWQAQAVEALPCGTPSKPDMDSQSSSLLRITDSYGKTLYSRQIIDPRIILTEDPKEPVGMLEKLDFTLSLPLTREMEAGRLEFYENPRKQDKPSAVADLSRVAADYWAMGGPAQQAPCQVAIPQLAPPPQPKTDGLVLNAEDFYRLVHEDQDKLIGQGLELDIHPLEVRDLVYKYRAQWAGLDLTEEDVKGFLDRYNSAYYKR